jgi:hypothetical protein
MVNPNPAEHIARHDPARVLAECEAKRRIVEPWKYSENEEMDWLYGAGALGRNFAMRALASVCADHPDYDDAWRR